MTKFNLHHIARAYSDDDLDILSQECERIAAELSNVVAYLDRQDGAIAASLVEMSDIIAKTAEAAELSKELKHGGRVIRIGGEYYRESYFDKLVEYYDGCGYSHIDAIAKVAEDHGMSEEDAVMVFGY